MERKPAEGTQPGDDSESAGLDRLPERLRRWQRFGGAQAAALAEAEALRREIDALAARLAQSEAGRRGSACSQQEELQQPDAGADDFPVGATESQPSESHPSESLRAWLALRRAGLAVGDAIARLTAVPGTATD